jgi:hypothetical protein
MAGRARRVGGLAICLAIFESIWLKERVTAHDRLCLYGRGRHRLDLGVLREPWELVLVSVVEFFVRLLDFGWDLSMISSLPIWGW